MLRAFCTARFFVSATLKPTRALEVMVCRQRPKDRETERQKDRQTERKKDRQTDRQKDRRTEGQRLRARKTAREPEKERQTDRQTATLAWCHIWPPGTYGVQSPMATFFRTPGPKCITVVNFGHPSIQPPLDRARRPPIFRHLPWDTTPTLCRTLRRSALKHQQCSDVLAGVTWKSQFKGWRPPVLGSAPMRYLLLLPSRRVF